MPNVTEVLVLVDDRAGHRAQAVGVAEALDLPYSIKRISYVARGGWPNFLKGASLLGVDPGKSDKLGPPWKAGVVIAAGRRTAPVARYIRRQARKAGNNCLLVQIMWPGFPSWGFDLIAAPEHDAPPRRHGVLVTPGAPHSVTPELLAREGDMWRKTIGDMPSPRIALLVGGSAGGTGFTASHAADLGGLAADLVRSTGGSLMVTSSRRTGAEAEAALKNTLAGLPAHFYGWAGQGKNRANPYYAFLALSDAIIVTGDSLSMCSEACAAGKPVFIFAPGDMLIPDKHRRLHDTLFGGGFARPLARQSLKEALEIIASRPDNWPVLPSPAGQVAEKIREMLALN